MKIIKHAYEDIDLEPKDLEYTLSTIYGKRAAKEYTKRGITLALKYPDMILEEEEE